MKKYPYRLSVLALVGLCFFICVAHWPEGAAQGPGQNSVNGTGRPQRQDEKPLDQEQELAEVTRGIAGLEAKPAAEVYKNIQMFKKMPAGRLPQVMGAWTRALGVSCSHCHVIDQWERDDKPQKQIARDMGGMMAEINVRLLKNIKNLRSESPAVTCSTCHRGQLKPETNLPPLSR